MPWTPLQVASRLNALYPMESNGDHYFTMIYGLLDVRTRRLRFTVAGHPAPILVREGSPPKRLDVTGFAIGMFDEAEYEESVIDLQRGDRLYLHSDGLTEEVNAQDEEFGDERLLTAIADGQASACKTPSNPWSRRSLPGEAKSASGTTYRFSPSQSPSHGELFAAMPPGTAIFSY